MKKYTFLLCIGIALLSCTENQRARTFGGDARIDVPAGNKVTNITWKGEDLWYSYRPFEEGEKPVTQKFIESSSFGLMEGSVTFYEKVAPVPLNEKEKSVYEIVPDTTRHTLR